MQAPEKSLSRHFQANAKDLERRLSAPQVFPHADDGAKARAVIAEFAAADAQGYEGDEEDEELVTHRLRNMRRLQKIRYEEWRLRNA